MNRRRYKNKKPEFDVFLITQGQLRFGNQNWIWRPVEDTLLSQVQKLQLDFDVFFDHTGLPQFEKLELDFD